MVQLGARKGSRGHGFWSRKRYAEGRPWPHEDWNFRPPELAGAGLCVAVIPPPEDAHAVLTGALHDNVKTQAWKIIVACFVAAGAGIGIALRVWLF